MLGDLTLRILKVITNPEVGSIVHGRQDKVTGCLVFMTSKAIELIYPMKRYVYVNTSVSYL